jgi:four helix bundle protein
MKIFELTKTFPSEEKYSLVDQIRRSSRSVCSNIGESWRRRRYKAAFISKLNDSETEATETRSGWKYLYAQDTLIKTVFEELFNEYEQIISQLVVMINQPEKWIIKQ